MQKEKPILDKRFFWDVDFNKIDYDKNPGWIIVRIFERGDIADIRKIRRYYGDRLIRSEIVKAKFIEEESLQFLSAIYQIPKEKFRCYKQKQLRGIRSVY